jgi:DNA-binding SARP family transcriptional activator
MAGLNLFVLGPPRLECDGQPVEVERRKALALLIYLAITGQDQRRDTLAALLWPEYDQASARAALRRTLFSLEFCDLSKMRYDGQKPEERVDHASTDC